MQDLVRGCMSGSEPPRPFLVRGAARNACCNACCNATATCDKRPSSDAGCITLENLIPCQDSLPG